MCFSRLAENTGRKNYAKNRHLRTITQLWPAISSQLRHVSTIGKKLFKQQYLLHMSSQYGKLQPTNSWGLLASLGHPSKFKPVSRLGFVSAPTSFNGAQQTFAGCLAISWAGTLYIHFCGLLLPNGIFPGEKFTLRPSLAFSYIRSVTVLRLSSGFEPNFVASYKEWNYGTVAESATYIRLGGHHVGHRLTF